jgi:hypothetical protein
MCAEVDILVDLDDPNDPQGHPLLLEDLEEELPKNQKR